MLSPQIPLRLISQYQTVEFHDGDSLEVRKSDIQKALKNCYITRDTGTEQMSVLNDKDPEEKDLLDDINQMRRAALLAIPLGQKALKLSTLEDFNPAEQEFRNQYVTLISSVKSFLWDAKGPTRNHLYPLVEELM